VTAAALTMNVGMLRHHEGFQNKNTPLTSEKWPSCAATRRKRGHAALRGRR
jgi:hypothetical protein